MSKPTQPWVSESMGAITVDGTRPYVFVTGLDGSLWADSWSGNAWEWTKLGSPGATPPGTWITESMGAITVDDARPYVFVKGGDGNFWLKWWSGGEWAWANMGIPPGTSPPRLRWTLEAMGAVTVDGSRPYLFVRRGDGNLWLNRWSGSDWAWTNQGQPPGTSIAKSMGATVVDGSRPYVFVTGEDGNLWIHSWSGSGWTWANQGRPPGTSIERSMGAITVDGGRPYVFVGTVDGKLWAHWWSGTEWNWSSHGKPNSETAVISAMGAMAVDGTRPYVFAKCTDSQLWVNWWSGSDWAWANLERPVASISESMGATLVDGGRPYVFVKGMDANLWLNWWSGTAWTWTMLPWDGPEAKQAEQ